MEGVLAIGIAWMLLSATTAYVVGDKRSFSVACVAAGLMVALGGEAWVHGVFGAVLFSPLLFATIPLARRMQRKKAPISPQQTGQNPSSSVRSGALPDAAVTKDGQSWKDIQAAKEANRKAQIQKRLEDLRTRVACDPVSVVLRRQVPVRFNEQSRSWLGGLPQMPEGVDWPRSAADGRPYHFVAQICCADLPDELWKGRGHRDGWLLFFLDAFNIGTGDLEEDDCVFAMHIDSLGPECAPPKDLRPVHNKIMSGPAYWQPQEDVPRVWRKWPVDLVAQKQELISGQVIAFAERDLSPKPTTSKELYGVHPQSDRPKLNPVDCPPLTWGGALAYLDWLLNLARHRSSSTATDQTANLRSDPGWLDKLISEAEQEEARLVDQIASFEEQIAKTETDEDRTSIQQALTRAQRYLSQELETLDKLRFYAANGGEDKLDAEISANVEGYGNWWKRLFPKLERLRARIARENPNRPLKAETWIAMRDVIYGFGRPTFTVTQRSDRAKTLRFGKMSLGEAAPWGGELMREHYLDLYTESEETNARIPEAAKAVVEEIARAINWDRPHRMGGFADPLQGDTDPADPPLLLQIASDDGMTWLWGDAGAIYIHARESDLDARRFDLTCRMECH